MHSLNKDIITEATAQTLYGLFCERVRRSPEALAYVQHDRHSNTWHRYTWRAVADLVARWQEALSREGLQPGDRVAVSMRNGLDWIAFDQAALGLGLVVVPLYVDDRPDNVSFILDESGSRFLLVQDGLRWRRLAEACLGLPGLQRIVVWDTRPEDVFDGAKVRQARDWLPPGEFYPRESKSRPEDMATLVYTSGTTGRPKGVMLTHHNILSVVESALQVVDVYREDLFLSFLPLSHMFERAVGYYLPVATGAAVAYSRSVAHLAEDLVQVRPSVMAAVPRVFERMYGRIMDQLRSAPHWRQTLFRFAVHVGWRQFLWHQGRRRWLPQFLLKPLLDALVGRRIRARLGGRLRLVVSGGAALHPSIARLFIGLGVPVLQGYGLTEASPQVSVNRLDDNDPTSVGRPLPGIDVRIGADGELLVRSPGIMQGYWNHPNATAAAIKDGWLHTGDQARLSEGRIYITGRIKDILVLSNGEKIPPGEMELAVAMDPLVEQVMIAGEGRAFLTALAVLNPERWSELAQQFGLDPDAPASLADKRVHHELLVRMGRQLQGFPSWAKVRRVLLSLEPWSLENGLLTPTLKIKRALVLDHFREGLDRIYQQDYPD